MDKKMNVAEFATLVGTTAKTIYQRISNNSDLPVNEQLQTVREKVKGREITVIITNDEQIELYKSFYGNNPVKNREYYGNVTDINRNDTVSEIQGQIFTDNSPQNRSIYEQSIIEENEELRTSYRQSMEELMNVNRELITVNKELGEVKGRQLLLEDKAGREGFYVNEINQLKRGKDTLLKVTLSLLIVSITLFISLVAICCYHRALDNNKKVNNPIETVNNRQQPQKHEVKPVKNQSHIKGKSF